MLPSETAAGPEPFGKYLLDREIARGGMARVHLARLRGLGGFEKRLVVKQILPHLASDPRFVSMFVEEAKTLVQMSHPHIVPVYELGIVDGVYFLAMEYVEGATLAEVLEDGPLDAAQAAHVGAQICDALSYAHERFGIVHRDVTPRNVIVDGAGHCRLLDFGIAAPAEDDAEGALFGTPGYLSPEQARGDAIGPASDLFALGAALHHALVGEPPWGADDLEAVRALAPGSEAAALATRGVDAGLGAIVDGALSIDPAARPDSARALGRALRGWLAARRPEGVAPELGARAERARTRRESRRASERPPAAAGGSTTGTARREEPRAVSTLAQSRALEEIIEGTTPIARASDPGARHEPRADEPGSAPTGGTAPLPGSAPPGDAAPTSGTVPLPGRSGRHDAVAPPRAMVAPRRARSPVGPLVVGLLAIAGATVLAVAARAPGPSSGGATEAAATEPPRDRDAPAPPRTSRTAPAVDPSGPLTSQPTTTPTSPTAPETPSATATAAEPRDVPRPRAATIAISSRDWAEIRIDGRVVGTTPIRRHAITAGSHQMIAANAPLGLSATTTFRAEPGTHLHAVVDFRATPPRIIIAGD